MTAAVITAGAVEVSNQVSTNAAKEGISGPSKVVAAAPPIKQVIERAPATDAADEAAAVVPAPADSEPPVVPAVLPVEADEVSVEEPVEVPAETPEVAEPEVIHNEETDDGLDGKAVDVPTVTPPPAADDPQAPTHDKPTTVGQTIEKPTPPATDPDATMPSTPGAAPDSETAPQAGDAASAPGAGQQ